MKAGTLTAMVRACSEIASALNRAEVDRRARLVLLDTLGVIWAGGQRPSARALADGDGLTGPWRQQSPTQFSSSSVLITGGGWASADRAAFLNASVACDLELDEGMRPTGHPALHILPAVIAAAEKRGSTVEQVLTALLVGYEVAGMLFQTFQLRPGVHPHGHLAAIASAAAVAQLCGVDPAAPALAAACLPLLTTWQPCLDGATIRNTWIGHAASVGILAQRYAEAGWTGSAGTLETAFDGLIGDRVSDPTPDLNSPQLLNGYFKLNSACALTHAAIEAARSLHHIDRRTVQSIEVYTTSNNMKVAAHPSANALSRRFSIPFAVATAIVNGAAHHTQFDDPDAESLELAGLVQVRHDPSATAAWPAASPATVIVQTADGAQYSAKCDNAPGTPANPATEEQLRDKFGALTGTTPALWYKLLEIDPAAKTSSLLQTLKDG